MAKTSGTEVSNGAVANAATQAVTVDCGGVELLTVAIRLQGTVTVGDVANPGATLFDSAGSLVSFITAVRSSGPASTGVDVVWSAQYDVRGIARLAVRFTNNNAASKNAIITVYRET